MCLFRVISSLFSHNTKTTSWLDPRLAKKAKPPEECKENGRLLSFYVFYQQCTLRMFVNSEERFLCKEAMIWLEPALNVLFPAGERGTQPRSRAMCLPVPPRRRCRSISSLSFLRVLFDLRPDFLPPTKDFFGVVQCVSLRILAFR